MTVMERPGHTPLSRVLFNLIISLTKSTPCPLCFEISCAFSRGIMRAVCFPLPPQSQCPGPFSYMHLPHKDPLIVLDGSLMESRTATDGTDYEHVTFRYHPRSPPRAAAHNLSLTLT